MVSLVLLAGSLLASVAFWLAGMPFFFLFLFIPLIPFLSRPREEKECPLCGFKTSDPHISFCPYDGTALIHSPSA